MEDFEQILTNFDEVSVLLDFYAEGEVSDKEVEQQYDTTISLLEDLEFKNWVNIESEEVVQEGYGKSAKSYLTYFYYEDEFEKIEIDSLNVTHRELENIVRTYRIRYNKNYRE